MTMSSTTTAPTVASVLARATALGPTISDRADEIERARRVPADLIDILVADGFFRVQRPVSCGGLGAALPETLAVVEALAAADASTAWTVMIGGMSWVDLLGLPRDAFDALWQAPPAIIAGTFAPMGSMQPAPGGFEVTGRWSFASGCEHADWIFGNCLEQPGENGPRMRIALFEPAQVTIEDTWHAVGLRGTGSQHFSVAGVRIPVERTTAPLSDAPCIDDPIGRIPTPTVVCLPIAAVALGIADGALRDAARLAGGKVPLLEGATLSKSPGFQRDYARAVTSVAAAGELLHSTAAAVWALAVDGEPISLAVRARARAAAAHAVESSAAAVTAAYRAAGSSAIDDTSPLQRRLRDVNVVTQHFIVKPDTFTHCGAAMLGEDLGVPLF